MQVTNVELSSVGVNEVTMARRPMTLSFEAKFVICFICLPVFLFVCAYILVTWPFFVLGFLMVFLLSAAAYGLALLWDNSSRW